MKSLLTTWFLTDIRFGLCVSSQMFLKITTGSEAFKAKITLKGPITGMNSLVNHQIRLVRKFFATYFENLTFLLVWTTGICILIINHLAPCLKISFVVLVGHLLLDFGWIMDISTNETIPVNRKQIEKLTKSS